MLDPNWAKTLTRKVPKPEPQTPDSASFPEIRGLALLLASIR